ncbi:MAG TPA: PAS domain S-box protein, partial [Verrucomicrobiae bacterium]
MATCSMGTAVVKVLLVEDTASDAELLTLALRGVPLQQFAIKQARTWAEAAQHLEEGEFDVLLLDLNLPDSRGPETFLRARAATPRLPIIVLTGNDDERLVLEAARHGIEDYLVKGSADGREIARAIRFAVESSRARETLGNYRELVQRILETASDEIYAKDTNGRYLLVNTAAARTLGRTPDEVIGKDDRQLFLPDDAKARQDGDRSVLGSGKTSSFEETITVASGERRTYISTKGLLRDAAGKTTGVFGISHDVTSMKRADRRLQGVATLLTLFAGGLSRRDYLESVVKFLKDWCGCQCVGVRLQYPDGRLPFVAQTGFTPGFLRHENRLSTLAGGCACLRVLMRQARPADGDCLSAGGSLLCNHTGLCEDHLGATPREAGHIACVKAGYESLVHTPMRYRDRLIGSIHFADEEPNKFSAETVSFIEAAALLIAEAVHRLNVEGALVESEARFRSMFERHDSVMLLLDPATGAIVDANPAAAAFYGYSRRRLRRMKIDELHHLPAETVGNDSVRAFTNLRKSWVLLHRLANRETRTVEGHSSGVKVRGRRLIFSIINDITERTRLQKEVLEIGERERQRIGQDLHDSLGGKLTGAALMGKALAQKLEALGLPDANLATEIV